MRSASDEKKIAFVDFENTEASQRKRAANQEAGDKAEQRIEHRGEAEEARRDSRESKNGNPALGLSPPHSKNAFSVKFPRLPSSRQAL